MNRFAITVIVAAALTVTACQVHGADIGSSPIPEALRSPPVRVSDILYAGWDSGPPPLPPVVSVSQDNDGYVRIRHPKGSVGAYVLGGIVQISSTSIKGETSVMTVSDVNGRLFPLAKGNRIDFIKKNGTSEYRVTITVTEKLDSYDNGVMMLAGGLWLIDYDSTMIGGKTMRSHTNDKIVWSEDIGLPVSTVWIIEDNSQDFIAPINRHRDMLFARHNGQQIGAKPGFLLPGLPGEPDKVRMLATYFTPEKQAAARKAVEFEKEFEAAQKANFAAEAMARLAEQQRNEAIGIMMMGIGSQLMGKGGSNVTAFPNTLGVRGSVPQVAPPAGDPARLTVSPAQAQGMMDRCAASCGSGAANGQRAAYEHAACICSCMGDQSCYHDNMGKAQSLGSRAPSIRP